MSFELRSYLEQHCSSANIALECCGAKTLNQKFDARRSLRFAAFTIFDRTIHEIIHNLGLSSRLSLPAATVGIGAVAQLVL
jgi:hypothetical protein